MSALTLFSEQQAVFDLIKNGNDNLFITGKAGTGKSVLLTYIVDQLKDTYNLAVVAYTGIAAINVGGVTISSLFTLAPGICDPDDSKQLEVKSRMSVGVLSELEYLIIDEVSMIRADIMDIMDVKLRKIKNQPSLPFGGCRVIMFGDLYQIAPIVEDKELEKYLLERYKTIFFFGAPVWKQTKLTVVELNDVHRQNDPDFINILNKIRVYDISEPILKKVNERRIDPPEDLEFITLTARKDTATEVNTSELEKLKGKEYTYYAQIEGEFKNDNCPTDKVLKLKVGCQVMMLQNDPNRRWVNGTIGKIHSLTDDEIKVLIDGTIYGVEKGSWVQYKYEYDKETKKVAQTVSGHFVQFPLMPAYAITTHKSQGQSFDHVMIDYGNMSAFTAGQTYVALSRCRSFDGLYLSRDLTREDFKSCQEIVAFMKKATTIKIDKPTANVACDDIKAEHQKVDVYEVTKPIVIDHQVFMANYKKDYVKFVELLWKEPLADKSYFSKLARYEVPPTVNLLVQVIRNEVNNYSEYFNKIVELKRMNRITQNETKQRLSERNVLYNTVLKETRELIISILVAAEYNERK